jgi:hypothetical protein
MTVVTVRPTSDITTGFDDVQPAGPHWIAVSDQSDASWVDNSIPFSTETDIYGKAAATIPPLSTINSLTLYIRGTGQGGVLFQHLILKIGVVLYLSPPVTLPTNIKTNKSYTWAANPSNGHPWLIGDIVGVNIGMDGGANLTHGTLITEVWLDIDFTPPAAALDKAFIGSGFYFIIP